MNIVNKIKKVLIVFKIFFFKFFFLFAWNECKNTILISERGNDARDNGYFFYKYLKEKHSDISVKYIISEQSPDYSKIESKDVVRFGSLKHYKYFLFSKYLVSTHLMGYSPDMNVCIKLNRFRILPLRGKQIFLQHGITKDYSKYFDYSRTHLDLFVCGALPEYLYIKKINKYPDRVIKNIGFCRFDNLIIRSRENCKIKSILIMPTWRHWHSNYNDCDFIESDFFKKYNALLNDKNFISFIISNNIEVYFYLHHETQKFSKLFSSTCSLVKICEKEFFDVQQLLIKCDFLITDYSSVFYDFAYMQKQLIYFQFDYDKYRGTHQEGYFSYQNDGFGPVCLTIEDVVKNLIRLNGTVEEEYVRRVENFFTMIDCNNCERTFNHLIKL